MKHDRFHGRHDAAGKVCHWPGCHDAGEFRAPGARGPGFDGPGEYRWFCLDHVRQFNAGYDFFEGMNPEEMRRAQSPLGGWESESRTFRADAGIDGAPRWADFSDPLDAINMRARRFSAQMRRQNGPAQRQDGRAVSPDERRALETLDLPLDADRRALRNRYAEMLRQYHPDHNGGDRRHEARLRSVVAAYQLLRKAHAFAR